MAIQAKNHFSEVVGLKNDSVYKVFGCPNCKTEVTVSRYQVEGQLVINCARCNLRYQVKGEELRELAIDSNFAGYEVFSKGNAAQFAAPVPKDSYLQFVKDGMTWKKPAPAAPAPAAASAGAAVAPKPADGAAPAA